MQELQSISFQSIQPTGKSITCKEKNTIESETVSVTNELTEKADEAIKDMSNDGKVVQLIYKNYSDGKYKVCGTDLSEDTGIGGPVDIEEVNQWGSELKNDNMKWLRILAEKHDLESGD